MLPLSGIVELRAEELVDLLPLYFVDIVAYGRTLPQHTVGGDASHTGIVVVAKTLPQRAAIGETVVPSHMMEPQQILIDGTPLQGIFRLVAIGLWSIVMVKGKDMVQA